MIPLQDDLTINPMNMYKKIKEIIDKYREDIETNDIFYYKELLNEIRNTSFWTIYGLSHNVCMHVYKKGNKQGTVCGAKIFIKCNNKKQKYLCSRHCRDYNSNNRLYTTLNARCTYIRSNKEQCKHRCSYKQSYCYVHNKDNNIVTNIYNNDINEAKKRSMIKKLEIRRKLFFKNKITRFTKFVKNTNISNFLEISNKINIFNKYNNYKKSIKYIKFNYNHLCYLKGIT